MPEPLPACRRWRNIHPIGYILLGLLALDLVVRAFSDTWERHSPDDYAARTGGCAAQRRDFVFVGGSPVSEGIDPTVVSGFVWDGRPMTDGYAIGLPGGTTSEFYHAVLRGCPAPPAVLVYGITASDLNDSRHEPHGPASLMTSGDVFDWATTRPDSRGWVVRAYLREKSIQAWALYRYRHGVRMWAATRADALLPGSCPSAAAEAKELQAYAEALRGGNGYAPAAGFVGRRYDTVKQVNAPLPPFTFLDRYKTGSHLRYLHKLVSWAKSHSTTLVLLDMPVTADLEAEHADAFSEYGRILSEVERTTGVPVIRAHRDVIGMTDAGFADTIHLNGIGAKRLSAWLKLQLDALGRGDDEGRVVRAQVVGGGP